MRVCTPALVLKFSFALFFSWRMVSFDLPNPTVPESKFSFHLRQGDLWMDGSIEWQG